MNRGKRPIMACVHRLKHVERLGSAALSYDDAVGTHPQRVANQVPNRILSTSFDVGIFCFHPHDVFLGQLQLGRIFDRDDPLLIWNEIAQAVEQCGLARASAT